MSFQKYFSIPMTFSLLFPILQYFSMIFPGLPMTIGTIIYNGVPENDTKDNIASNKIYIIVF